MNRCKRHRFNWEKDDKMGCPICYGEKKAEQRFIKLLEEQKASMEAMETGYRSTSGNMAIRIKTIEAIIDLIRSSK